MPSSVTTGGTAAPSAVHVRRPAKAVRYVNDLCGSEFGSAGVNLMLMLGPSDVLLAPPEDSVEDTDEGKDCSFANVCSARGLRSSARWVGSSVWVVKSFSSRLNSSRNVDSSTTWSSWGGNLPVAIDPACSNAWISFAFHASTARRARGRSAALLRKNASWSSWICVLELRSASIWSADSLPPTFGGAGELVCHCCVSSLYAAPVGRD